MLNLRCLGDSSWMGGVSGRLYGSWLSLVGNMEVDEDVAKVSTEDLLPSLISPEALSVASPPLFAVLSGLGGISGRGIRESGLGATGAGSIRIVCLLMSVSLALTPRRRKKGIVIDDR